MLKEKIRSAFGRDRKLKVLFFFDPTGDSKEEVARLSFDDIRVVSFDGRWLYYKVMFDHEWKNDRVFFYFEQSSPKQPDELHDFQLLDLLCANRELAPDNVEDFMSEYRLLPHHQPLVSKYRVELKRMPLISVVQPLLNAAQFEEKALQQGILSEWLGFSKIESWDTLLIRLLTYSLPEKQSYLATFLNKLQKSPLLEELNRHVQDIFGMAVSGMDETEIADLMKRLKYNLITQNLTVSERQTDSYGELKVTDPPCLQAMNRLYKAATQHPKLNKSFNEALAHHGQAVQAEKIVSVYGYDADFVYLPDDLLWEILRRVLDTDFAPSDALGSRLNSLKMNLHNKGPISHVISFMDDALSLFTAINQEKSVILDIPEDYIRKYTESYYQVDSFYRRAVFAYQELNNQSTPLDDALSALKKRVDKDYFDFTFRLNNEWLRCMKDADFDYKRIQCDKQFDFYEKKVAPLNQKVAVIISDALRYEAAVELLGELHSDDKNVSTLSAQLASIPSTTKFGMANLLPARNRVFNEGEILLDGEKAATTEQREKILQRRKEDSRAVKFETVSDNDTKQNRELFKSSVVYVYHDVIDKTGHKSQERKTFSAVKTAVIELSKLAKQILSGFNVAKVFITSDHGFLYNDYDIAEADKNEIEDTEIVESDARHYITKEHIAPTIGYKMPLFKTTLYEEPYYVVIPDSVNRFKKAGSSYRFTHGGGSLQELVIPIIECIRKEERVHRKVDLMLTNEKDLKIISNSLRLNVIQKNLISANEKERTVKVGIYENEQLVSNLVTMRFNSSDPKPNNRIQSATLVLNNNTSSTILKLKVYDVEDRLNPLIEKNVTNNTLMARDF